jgi:hypothetical protein
MNDVFYPEENNGYNSDQERKERAERNRIADASYLSYHNQRASQNENYDKFDTPIYESFNNTLSAFKNRESKSNGRSYGEYRTPVGVPHRYEMIPSSRVSDRDQNRATSSYGVSSYHNRDVSQPAII